MRIEGAVAVLKERPWGAKLMVTGELNINMEDPEGGLEGGVDSGSVDDGRS